jgi:hypothetical protein
MTIRDCPSHTLKVFLPKRYSAVITDADLENINSRKHPLNLIFKGCINTNSCMLTIEKFNDCAT